MQFVLPVGIVVGIGLLAGVILTVAAKFMAVAVDETAATEALPGANCGAWLCRLCGLCRCISGRSFSPGKSLHTGRQRSGFSDQ